MKLPLGVAAASRIPVVWTGINLSGVNFVGFDHGVVTVNDPDVPDGWERPTNESVDYFAGLGFRLARVTYKLERMQSGNNQPLGNAAKERTYINSIIDFQNYCRSRGMTVVPVPNNFGYRRIGSTEYYVGTSQFPVSAFADFHSRLAQEPGFYAESDQIDLCGEPYETGSPLDTAGLARVDNHIAWCNACIAAIRARGLANFIHVPGMHYALASGWEGHGTKRIFAKLVDPAPAGFVGTWTPRLIIQLHQYYDTDQAGDSPETNYGILPSRRLRMAREDALWFNFKLSLGGTNVSYDTTATQADVDAGRNALHDMMQELIAYQHVWESMIGFCGGGRRDGNDRLSLDPWSGGYTPGNTDLITTDGAERDKTTIIKGYIGNDPPRIIPNSTLDLDLARNLASVGTTVSTGSAAGPIFAALLPCQRSTSRPAPQESGREVDFAANVLRRTRRGLRIDAAVNDDNLITTQNFISSGSWIKSTESGKSITLTNYVDPDDNETYTRLQMTGDTRTSLSYPLSHTGPAIQSIEVKTLGDKNQYVGFENEGKTKDINISNGVDGPYIRNEWQQIYHSCDAGEEFRLHNRTVTTDMLIRHAKVHLGTVPTPWYGSDFDDDHINLTGALLTALQGDCTILIQVRDLDITGLVVPILSATVGGSEIALLTRAANGGVSTAYGGAQATLGQPLDQWASIAGGRWGSRRVALAKRASPPRVVIGCTGALAVGTGNTPGAITSARLGALGSTRLNGLVERVTILPYMGGTPLETLVA